MKDTNEVMRFHRRRHRVRRRRHILSVIVLLTACGGGEGRGQDRLSGSWFEWQRIEATQPPSAWQVEEASFAFDAWEASAVATQLSVTSGVTTIRFDDGEGGVLEVRLPALPSERFSPTLAAGEAVRVALIRRQGFEGVAQGLTVFDEAGRLLLLYDDGGYGPAFYGEGPRAGLVVDRALRGIDSGDTWEQVEVTFQLDDESVVLAEGQSARLGGSGLVVKVVVSREWTGPIMTDIDLSPLAYLVFRTDGSP